MADPAAHSARMDGERRQVLLGSDATVIEAAAIADAAGDPDDDFVGAWLVGEAPVPALWGVKDPL